MNEFIKSVNDNVHPMYLFVYEKEDIYRYSIKGSTFGMRIRFSEDRVKFLKHDHIKHIIRLMEKDIQKQYWNWNYRR